MEITFNNMFPEYSIKDLNLGLYSILKASSLVFLTTGILYLGKIFYSYTFFKRRGLKTPKYEFFYGNMKTILKNKNFSDQIKEWTKTYGKTYGYFEGHLPILVTSDLEIIQEVFIKQASNFAARKKAHLNPKDNDPYLSLFFATGNRWKRMRMIMNPTFSSAKLRELGPMLVKCADRMVNVLDKEKETEINITQYFKRFTMDSIWNCAFGVDINMQYEKDNEYFNKCEGVFRILAHLSMPQYLGIYFYEFKEIILEILETSGKIFSSFLKDKNIMSMFWLRSKVGELVSIRKNSKNVQNKKDYIQLLIDARAEFNELSFDSSELKKVLTTKEVEANLVLFMLAGYETTSTTLSSCSHVLATHPEEQSKLHDEISSAFGSDLDSINSDSVQELHYLDMFVKEVLRMYPIGTLVRRCIKSTTIKGIHFPVNTPIAVDVMSLHFDPELWGPVDPDLFYPPRHEIKRNQLAFMAFGNGPRHCIGMKFALIELKIALVKLLLNFEFLKTTTQNNKLEIEEGLVRYPKNGVQVLLRRRNE
nr:cytochrome P450 3045C7 [Brachionus rubens]